MTGIKLFESSSLFSKPVSIAPLASFRIIFGLIMLVSIIRFAAKGWIYELYVKPEFHFTFYGFDWIKPLPGWGMYLVFLFMGLAALFIMLGYLYRCAAVLFFILFTYVELIDKTYYLNHYYFISIISFLLIFLPANRAVSLDMKFNHSPVLTKVPAWTINLLKFQLMIVYFYAGLAKINPEWLLEAMPLKIWLPARAHFAIIGDLFSEVWVAYVFSWAGMLYDISIPFLLLNSRTRPIAYIAVIFFHLLTRILFPIGMFPYIMIGLTLIFFSPEFHEKLLKYPARWAGRSVVPFQPFKPAWRKLGVLILTLHFIFQLIFPFRHMLYPGKLFWTEEGYRFSWRVMLMEKAGICTFHITNRNSGNHLTVDNNEHLTVLQERMMATQPDMILQYAHYLKDKYGEKGFSEVYAESHVTLQGHRSRPLVDPRLNLANIERSLKPKKWILPFDHD
jgi:hypothetical protein